MVLLSHDSPSSCPVLWERAALHLKQTLSLEFLCRACQTTPQCQKALIPFICCSMSLKNAFLKSNPSFTRLGTSVLLPITLEVVSKCAWQRKC